MQRIKHIVLKISHQYQIPEKQNISFETVKSINDNINKFGYTRDFLPGLI